MTVVITGGTDEVFQGNQQRLLEAVSGGKEVPFVGNTGY